MVTIEAAQTSKSLGRLGPLLAAVTVDLSLVHLGLKWHEATFRGIAHPVFQVCVFGLLALSSCYFVATNRLVLYLMVALVKIPVAVFAPPGEPFENSLSYLSLLALSVAGDVAVLITLVASGFDWRERDRQIYKFGCIGLAALLLGLAVGLVNWASTPPQATRVRSEPGVEYWRGDDFRGGVPGEARVYVRDRFIFFEERTRDGKYGT